MRTKPLITIVVPVYKVPYEMLHRCIRSIINQKKDNFEVILVDDGSPDKCGEICDQYASVDSRLRTIHQKNGGLSVVRNVGINEALGEWICFVDGDDWIEDSTTEFAEQYINSVEGNVDILIWDEYYEIDQTKKANCFIKDCGPGINYYSDEKKQILIDMFLPRYYKPFTNNYVDLGTANARLYRKAFLVEHQIYNIPGLRRMQDNVFNLWAIEKASNICYQCRRLYHYCYNDTAATQKYSPDNVDVMYFLYESMEDYILKNNKDEEFYQRVYCRFIRIFGEIYKLNFANPNNPGNLIDRIHQAQEAFSREKFKDIINKFNSKGQSRKIIFIHYLLKKEYHFLLIMYYWVSIKTRKLRVKVRRNN